MLRAKQHIARFAGDRLPTDVTDEHGNAEYQCRSVQSVGIYVPRMSTETREMSLVCIARNSHCALVAEAMNVLGSYLFHKIDIAILNDDAVVGVAHWAS